MGNYFKAETSRIMNRSPKTVQDAAQLLQLCDLLTNSVRTIVNEWGKESGLNASATKGLLEKPTHQSLPSHELYQAQRTVLAITGSLTELVHDGPGRIQELACQFWESRALFIAAERRIPDLLAEADGQTLTAEQLGSATGIEYLKLGTFSSIACNGILAAFACVEIADIDGPPNQHGSCDCCVLFMSSKKCLQNASQTIPYQRH